MILISSTDDHKQKQRKKPKRYSEAYKKYKEKYNINKKSELLYNYIHKILKRQMFLFFYIYILHQRKKKKEIIYIYIYTAYIQENNVNF